MTIKELEEAIEFYLSTVANIEDKEIKVTIPQVVRYFERLLIFRGLK